MPEFHVVAKESELAEGQAKTVKVGNKLIALFRYEGQVLAIDDLCTHMGASLTGGHVEKGVVTCPWHAWRFRLSDGCWVDNPKLKIGSYPARVVNGAVEVEV